MDYQESSQSLRRHPVPHHRRRRRKPAESRPFASAGRVPPSKRRRAAGDCTPNLGESRNAPGGQSLVVDWLEQRKSDMRRDRAGGEDHEHARLHKPRGSRKKKHGLTSGRNVMGTYTSDAVLNDRITIQPALKPGLFDNKRMSKKQPVRDLAFSEMHFLKHQKHDSRPKPLSKSRLRERQRENRELEQVSSFFLPRKRKDNHEATRSSLLDIPVEPTRRHDRQREASLDYEECSSEGSPSRSTLINEHHQRSSTAHDSPNQRRSLAQVDHRRPARQSSKTTTYFTWSSSHHSPPASREVTPMETYRTDTPRATTPETIKAALIATGIYKHTGIEPYDVPSDHRSEDSTVHSTVAAEVQSRSLDKNVNGHPDNVADDMSDIIRQRWTKIVTAGRRNSQSTYVPRSDQGAAEAERATGHSNVLHRHESHPRMAPKVHTETMAKYQDTDIHEEHPPRTFATHAKEPEQALRRSSSELENRLSSSPGRTSLSSRVAMPPPPLPSRKQSCSTGIANNGTANTWEVQEGTRQAKASETQENAARTAPPAPELRTGCEEIPPLCEGIRSPNSASWIPQSRTPSIVNLEREKCISRLSVRSPIYASQMGAEPVRVTRSTVEPPTAHDTENMADFIARIEDEALDRDFDARSCSTNVEMDSDASAAGPVMDDDKRQLHQSPDSRTSPATFTRLSRGLSPSNDAFLELEAQIPWGGQSSVTSRLAEYDNTKHTGVAADSFETERLEMSAFWRPNMFPQL
ncbi:hypothetical protein GGR56DRAFT_223972 [Xylariaceae sp. FL0804]|nr:hypothetical protein GGR56DRAFT_223972 [Xylariaceae sp. FL0804]